MRRYLDLLYRASGWLAALFLLSICGLVMAQVALNIVDRIASATTGTAIGLTIPSYADFTGFFLAAASFLALAYTLREGGHIRVTLFIQNLPPRFRHFVELWCVGLVTAITVYFTWYTAALTHESFVYNDLSPGMVPVPIWIPQTSVLIGLAVLSIALIDELVGIAMGGDASYEGKGENLLHEARSGAPGDQEGGTTDV